MRKTTNTTETKISKISYRDFFAIDDPKIDCLVDFDDDKDVMDYVVPLGFVLGAKMLGCKTCTEYIRDKNNHGANHKCLAYVNTVCGKVTNVKLRAIDTKSFTQWLLPDKHLPIPPYNIDCLSPERLGDNYDVTLIVTEGEKDVCSLVSAGYRYVISVPNGAQAKPETYLEPFTEWLEAVARVVICHDEDEAGYDMMHNVSDYFRRQGKAVAVTRMPYGCKDVSDLLYMRGETGVRKVVDTAPFSENSELVYPSAIAPTVKDVLNGIYDHGYGTGFGELTDRHLWLTGEGGLIVVTGKPNSGKTDWCRCLMAHLALQQGKGVCFCSFEEPNKAKHLAALIRIAMCDTDFSGYTDNQLDSIIRCIDDYVVDISPEGGAPTPRHITRLCEAARRRHPIDFLYVDPYLFIDPDCDTDSETLQIKQVLTHFQSWGRRHHVWVVIVAHPRKLVKDAQGKYEEIDEYTISGSAHWANLADYLMSVKRVFVSHDKSVPDSSKPSYTQVSVMKVRDQTLCHTGQLFFLRQPCGRYDERTSDEACKRELDHAMPMPGDTRDHDAEAWLTPAF